jgi:Protein of unknown function (DUF3025)
MPKSGQHWEPGFLQRSPLLGDFLELAAPLLAGARGWPTLEQYTALVEQERRTHAPELEPVRFSPAQRRSRRAKHHAPVDLRQLYDGRVVLLGEVPCLSESYHDLCNVLAWSAFPRTKRALHARQFRALVGWVPGGATRLPNRRTREQDALTLFDEGGSVLVSARGEGARLVLFGHALMEHVGFQESAIGSAVLELRVAGPLPGGPELLERIDRELAERLLRPGELCTPAFDQSLLVRASDSPFAWSPSARAGASPAEGTARGSSVVRDLFPHFPNVLAPREASETWQLGALERQRPCP